MAQVAFNGTALGTGSLFSFFEQADTAIKTYLESASHTGRLKVLRDHLVTSNTATIKAHTVRSEQEYERSQSEFPLIYVMSGSWRIEDFETNSLNLFVDTELRIWARGTDPDATGKLCVDIAGTIGSMLAQSKCPGSGVASTDWTAFYLGDGDIESMPSADRVLFNGTHALQTVRFSWTHNETW